MSPNLYIWKLQKRAWSLCTFALFLLLSACTAVVPPPAAAPADESSTESTATERAETAAIVLPDGLRCLFAGTGATLAFDEKRLNYTCEETDEAVIGLIGDIAQPSSTMLAVERANIVPGDEGFTLESSEIVTFTVNWVTLADGTQCAHAGEGATLAFNEKRLNYTCGEEDDASIGLIGELLPAGEGIWTVEKAVIGRDDSGFVLNSSALEVVTELSGAEDAAMPPPNAQEDELVGTVWQWQRTVMSDDSVTEPNDPTRYTLEFLSDGRLAMQADCNRGNSAYTLDGNQLTIEGGAMTMMACPPDSLDSVFLEQLGQVGSYLFSDGNLVLELQMDSGGMFFAPAAPEADTSTASGTESDTESATEDMDLSGVFTGTVTYLQRIALPPGSVIEVQLEDVSRADAAAEIIASQTITTSGENVPIPFELTYDPAQIEPRNRYALRARITIEGDLRWINTENQPVLTNENPTTGVEVLVQPVG